jgi:hypothetical protein
MFEPSIPKPGYIWDYSALESDGIIRVKADPVGIDRINADSAAGEEIYDLSGRRLNKVGDKGVYIVNGKKIVVK